MKRSDELLGQTSLRAATGRPGSQPGPVPDAGDAAGVSEAPLEGMAAQSGRCRFCSHANPPGAKFCNTCGGQLNLASCPACGAINDDAATRCHHCGASLSEAAEAPVTNAISKAPDTYVDPRHQLALAPPFARPPRSTAYTAIAFAAVFVLAAVAVFLLRAPAPEKADATGTSDETSRTRPIGQAGVPREPPAGAASSTDAAAAGCTDAVAALGLCTPAARTPQGSVPVAAGAATATAPKTAPPCTEQRAALGLCAPTPQPTQERRE